MKNLKIFENFEARVFSHKKLVPQIRASFTHHARASYRHNFFFGTVQMTRGQRARVKSHQKFVPQIRASFTHHARASSTRRYACFTRGQILALNWIRCRRSNSKTMKRENSEAKPLLKFLSQDQPIS